VYIRTPQGALWLHNAQVHQRAITGTVVDQLG
jgi:hypothetical protein